MARETATMPRSVAKEKPEEFRLEKPPRRGHDACVTTVAEIKQAVTRLSPTDYRRFSRWLEEQKECAWDRQIEADARAGKFDRVLKEAEAEYKAGKTRKL